MNPAEEYTIEVRRTRLGYRARVTTIGIGNLHHAPSFWRRTEIAAQRRAERWCNRDVARRRREAPDTYRYTPA